MTFLSDAQCVPVLVKTVQTQQQLNTTPLVSTGFTKAVCVQPKVVVTSMFVTGQNFGGGGEAGVLGGEAGVFGGEASPPAPRPPLD